ncbi:hypothetical protein [Paraburkholderia sp. MM6662-R1]|uniref:hypothetical protein n=1 Tax=Paraburkholderia sp. MM6662-R1 TaxID=2991066 RepID=UPI003D1B5923
MPATDRIFIDRFSAGLDDLKRAEQRDPATVLARLATMKRFSCFEASANQGIARTMDHLIGQKYVECRDLGYPWTGVTLTEAGRRFLRETQKKC